MSASSLPGSGQTPLDDENARKQRELRDQFPLGIAPYTRGNLLAFGFWGGIVGAGIAGMVNSSRSNQSRAIPSLVLTMLAFLLIDWLILIVLIDRATMPGSQIDQGVLPIAAGLANIALGLAFAAWIANRQRAILQRWRDLAAKPSWRDQGGCLGAVGWVILGAIVSFILYNVIFVPFLPTVFQVIYPPQRFTVEGISGTTPAGWAQMAPEIVGVNCAAGEVTCLAIVSERWTGSAATLLTISGANPVVLANAVALQLLRDNPLLPPQEVEAYAPEFLSGRSAAAFSVDLGDRRFVYTAVADGDRMISLSLTCSNGLQSQCEATRDQFIAAIDFAT